MDHTIRIVIADDHAFVRTSLHSMLKLEQRLTVVAEAKNGSEAIAMVEKHRPDVVLMDISMSVLNGIDATRIINSKFPNTKVIVLNMHTDQAYSDCAYAAGASCFLAKGCDKDEILDAIMECSLGT
jgi:DNA-binding NarL/FixJ family response regulator